jgi:hypothetical protein
MPEKIFSGIFRLTQSHTTEAYNQPNPKTPRPITTPSNTLLQQQLATHNTLKTIQNLYFPLNQTEI